MRSTTRDSEPRLDLPQLPPPDFNRLAHIYRWLEWFSFGPILSRCRYVFLPEMKNRHSALIIGDGDGRFTARLLQQNPHITVDAVDASEVMLLELTRRAKSNAKRLNTHNADAREFNPASRHYDLVATHFFLDCLSTDEVAHLADCLRGSMTDGALWVVSEFAIPKTRYGRLVAKPLITALYRAFGMLTGLRVRRLPDHPTALSQSGFKLIQRRERLFGLLVSELWLAESRS